MNRTLVCCLGTAVLLLFFCHRIWSLGPTHTDDAAWLLAAHDGDWGVISRWATSQGRLFALVSGLLIYIGNYFQGSTAGSILHVGSFLAFFVGVHALLRVYFGVRVALLTAALNVALFAIRWEGSIVTSYPLFSWTLGTVFVAAVYAGWRYYQVGRPALLGLSCMLLLISLNIHEGVSVLFAFLALLAAVGNVYLARNRPDTPFSWRTYFSWSALSRSTDRRFVRQMSATAGVVGLYFLGYAVWRLVYPSEYSGNQFGSFNPVTVVPVLLSLSASGSVLTDLIVPYTVNFADAVGNDGYGVVYRPLHYLSSQGNTAIAMLVGAILAAQVFALMTWKSLGDTCLRSAFTRPRFWCCLAVAAAIALLPVLPVSLVGRYQQQFYELKVRSYAFTPLCHFGWALGLAAVLGQLYHLRHRWPRQVAAAVVSAGLGILGYCASLKNDAVVADIRRETSRWTAMHHLATLLPELDHTIATVHAPRLRSGSWFSVVDDGYWSRYMQARHGRSVHFENQSVSRDAIAGGLAYVDYTTARGNTQPVVFAAALDLDSQSDQIIAREIAVSLADPDPSDLAQYRLSYRDPEGANIACRLSQLAPEGETGTIRAQRGVRAIPSSIRVSRDSYVSALNVECGDYVSLGRPVRFCLGSSQYQGDLATRWLGDQWHPPEVAGIWSKQAATPIRIPLADPPAWVSVTLSASTLTGIGWSDQPQTVTVQIGSRVAATKTFARGDGYGSLRFDVNREELAADGSLQMSLLIDDVINPAKRGVSNDTRDLGVYLQGLVIERSDGSPAHTAAGAGELTR